MHHALALLAQNLWLEVHSWELISHSLAASGLLQLKEALTPLSAEHLLQTHLLNPSGSLLGQFLFRLLMGEVQLSKLFFGYQQV